MRIIMFVTNPFTTDARVYYEASSLIQAGHQVTVVAYNSEKKYPPRENMDDIEIIRVPPISTRRGIAGVISKGVILLLWQLKCRRLALHLHRQNSFDAAHCHDLDTLPIGVALKRRLGLHLVYDAHEIYGYMLARDLPFWIASRFLWLEKRLLRYVDHVISVDEAQKRYLDEITDKPITLVMNCKPLQLNHYRPPDNDVFTVLYIGVLHKGRPIPLLIDAVEEMDGVKCMIGGVGPAGQVQEIADRCATARNAQFLGKVPMQQVIPWTLQADLVFLMLNPNDLNNRNSLANKQFEAMVCGRPIICTKGTYSGNLTEQEKVGLTVEYNKEALKEAIAMLRDNPELREQLGRNALHAALGKYNWEKEEQGLLEIYKNLDSL
jgi:glycosyltransferase involved in cell wall biosynthesis